MPVGTYVINVSIGGLSVSKSITRTADHPNVYSVVLPAAEAGTLSTRTNASAGVLNIASHTVTNTDTVDVYWSASNLRYGMAVANANATHFEISGGTGDDLPTVNTNITAAAQVQINSQIDGDAVSLLALSMEMTNSSATTIGHIDMQDSGNSTIEAVELTANVPRVWDITGGDTNVFTGNPITHSEASNGSSAANATLKILSLEDSTP